MSAPRVQPIPEGAHSLTPHLVCNGAAHAIEFYTRAFGAVEESGCLARTEGWSTPASGSATRS